jgi:deazaflavin-dependent oxidoreductase (nitroreductase family)
VARILSLAVAIAVLWPATAGAAGHPLRSRQWLSRGRISISVGWPILLLTHTGARSGKQRRTALLYAADGENIVLVASKAGAKRNPAWFHNLKANPQCGVLAGRRSGDYAARVLEGVERRRAWELATGLYMGYAAYQGRTDRRIPVLILEPRS